MADRAVPNLPSRDLDATAAFYGRLGLVPVHRDDGWLVLRRGGVQLEFFPVPDLVPERGSAMCSVRVDDLDALHRRIAAAGVPEVPHGMPRLSAIRREGWGGRVAFLVDPDGTQLNLVQEDAEAAPSTLPVVDGP